MALQLFDPEELSNQITDSILEPITNTFGEVYKGLLQSVLTPQLQAMGLSEDEIETMLSGDEITQTIENMVQLLVTAITQVVVKNAILGQFQSLKNIFCSILQPLSMFFGGIEGCDDNSSGGNNGGGGNGGNENPSSILSMEWIQTSAELFPNTNITLPNGLEYEPDGNHLMVFIDGLLQNKGVDYEEVSRTAIKIKHGISSGSYITFIVANF